MSKNDEGDTVADGEVTANHEMELSRHNGETNALVGERPAKKDGVLSDMCVEPTVPHGRCKDTNSDNTAGILHPGMAEGSDNKVGVACCHGNG